MPKKDDILSDSVNIIKEIEENLELSLKKKKEEIEGELKEKIKAEKEETEKKISQLEKEYDTEKEVLTNYREMIIEFESSKIDLQNQIRGHLDQGIQYQKEIEKLTSMTLEELKKVSELSMKIEELRHGVEEKASLLKKEFEEKFGGLPEIFNNKEHEEIVVDLEQEVVKLKKIKELLESDASSLNETEENHNDQSESQMQEAAGNEGGFEGVPKIEEVMESSMLKEQMRDEETAGAGEEKPEESGGEAKENDSEAALEILKKYRKSEQVHNGHEISYFQNGPMKILDGESLLKVVDSIIGEAKELFEKISGTESPKEQFFFKQDLINHQEMLRRLILKSLQMCEEEGYTLPQHSSDILNSEILRDMLEKLSMSNWSKQDDFKIFEKHAHSLGEAFSQRISSPASFFRSLIKDLGV